MLALDRECCCCRNPKWLPAVLLWFSLDTVWCKWSVCPSLPVDWWGVCCTVCQSGGRCWLVLLIPFVISSTFHCSSLSFSSFWSLWSLALLGELVMSTIVCSLWFGLRPRLLSVLVHLIQESLVLPCLSPPALLLTFFNGGVPPYLLLVELRCRPNCLKQCGGI